MNPLQILKNTLGERFPHIKLGFDPAACGSGSSWLDIEADDQSLTVEWKPNFGFGLYISDSDTFDSGPTEIYRKESVLLKRLDMLIFENRLDIKMKELRELVGKTQQDLSLETGQKQSSISKFENRNDFQISSLEKFIEAFRGTLEVRAHFQDFDLPIVLSKNSKKIVNNK